MLALDFNVLHLLIEFALLLNSNLTTIMFRTNNNYDFLSSSNGGSKLVRGFM